MFPKMGKTIPDEGEGKVDQLRYRLAIAAALKRELGGSHRGIKTLMRWTSVSERTAKNWLVGSNGPAGEHLVELMRHSDEVLGTILDIAGRDASKAAIQLSELRSALVRMASIADETLKS